MRHLRSGLALVVAVVFITAGAACPQGMPGSGAGASSGAASSAGASGGGADSARAAGMSSSAAASDPSFTSAGATSTPATGEAPTSSATSATGDGAASATSTATTSAPAPTGTATSATAASRTATTSAAAPSWTASTSWTTIDIDVATEDGHPLAGATIAVAIEKPAEAATLTATIRLDAAGAGTLPLPRLSDPRVTARVIGVDIPTVRKLEVSQRSHSSTTDIRGALGIPRLRFRLARDVEHPIEAYDGAGAPLAGSRVVLEHPASVPGAEPWRFTVDLDERGRAKRRGLPGGAMRWTVTDAGGHRHEGQVTIKPAKPGLRITLTKVGTIVLRALDDEGRPHDPPPAGMLELTDPRLTSGTAAFRGPLGADGTSRCTIPAGDYAVTFAPERTGGAPARVLHDVRDEAVHVLGGGRGPAPLVRVAGSATTTAEVRIERRGLIEARVTRSGGPAAAIRVEAESRALLGAAECDAAVTGSDGVARLLARGPTLLSVRGLPKGQVAAACWIDADPRTTTAVVLSIVPAGALRVDVREAGGGAAASTRGCVFPAGQAARASRWTAEPRGATASATITLAPGAYELPWEGRLIPVEVRAAETATVALVHGGAPEPALAAGDGATASGAPSAGASTAASATGASGASTTGGGATAGASTTTAATGTGASATTSTATAASAGTSATASGSAATAGATVTATTAAGTSAGAGADTATGTAAAPHGSGGAGATGHAASAATMTATAATGAPLSATSTAATGTASAATGSTSAATSTATASGAHPATSGAHPTATAAATVPTGAIVALAPGAATTTATATASATAATGGTPPSPTAGPSAISVVKPAVEAPGVTRGAIILEGTPVREAYATGRFGVALDASLARHDRDHLCAVRRIELPAGRARIALGTYGDPEGAAESRYVLFVVVPKGGELLVTLPRPGRGAIAAYGACRGPAALETSLELVGMTGPLRSRAVNDVALWDRLPAGRYRVMAGDRVIEEISLEDGELRDLGWRDVTP